MKQSRAEITSQQNQHTKCKLINCLLISILFTFALYTISLISAIHQYFDASSRLHQTKQTSDARYDLLQSLEGLTDSWYSQFTHPYFYEEKIYELSKQSKWEEVINESRKALENRQLKNKFSIWYHKGVAECFLQKFNECRESYFEALYIKDEDGSQYLERLFSILYSNGLVKKEQSPLFKPPQQEQKEEFIQI